jgi:hypothetical protein
VVGISAPFEPSSHENMRTERRAISEIVQRDGMRSLIEVSSQRRVRVASSLKPPDALDRMLDVHLLLRLASLIGKR